MLKLNLSATRTATLVAAAIAVLTITAAIACSSAATTSTATPVPTFTPTPEPELTPDRLMLELRAAGFEFESPELDDNNIFARMYGAVDSFEQVLSGNEDGTDKISTHEFIGPAEALIAATRIFPDGAGYSFPSANSGPWVNSISYGGPFNANMFVSGRTIAVHVGDDTELTDALEQLMGEPFAGTRVNGKWNVDDDDYRFAVNYPKFDGMWIEEPVEFKDFTITPRSGTADTDTTGVSVRFSINEPNSISCVGPRILTRATEGNELRITYLSRIANTEKLNFVNDCVINYGWREIRDGFSQLEPGKTYTVLFNGEVVATIGS